MGTRGIESLRTGFGIFYKVNGNKLITFAMLDIDRLFVRFGQFGGWRVLREYARMGVLGTGCWTLAKCIFKGQSVKRAYHDITERVDRILERDYSHLFKVYDNVDWNSCNVAYDRLKPKIIWTAWLQGIDHAPEIVKVCWDSQKAFLPDYEYRIMTLENFHQWVSLPDDIIGKFKKGAMPPACFADLLRLAALKEYGGVWMDASLLCTGLKSDRLKELWCQIENSELTIPRYFRKGERCAVGLGNWFISAKKWNRVINGVFDAMIAYWHDHDCVTDYYMMHLFLALALRRWPETSVDMPRLNGYHCIMMGDWINKGVSKEQWDDLTAHVAFHKLNYRKIGNREMEIIKALT